MGVFDGEMTVAIPADMPPEMRFGLPKLVIAFWLVTELDDIPDRAAVTVFAPPGRKEIFKTDIDVRSMIPASLPEWATKFSIHGDMPFLNFLIAEDGIIEVVVDTERETIVAGRVRVRLQPPSETKPLTVPTASEPPFEQSAIGAQETKTAPARRRPSVRRRGRTPEPE
jgi:hypothetical protein